MIHVVPLGLDIQESTIQQYKSHKCYNSMAGAVWLIQSVLYDLYSTEPEGYSPDGEGLYQPYGTRQPCYMQYIS